LQAELLGEQRHDLSVAFVGRFGRMRKVPAFGRAETVIAIEFAHDLYDAIDRLKVGPRHGVIGHAERLLETAHLLGNELRGRFWHAASENVSNERAHVLLANVLPLRDRNAAARGLDDPPFPARLRLARRAPRLDRSVSRDGGRSGFDGIRHTAFLLHDVRRTKIE
jgi:hypothetical protein